jgi:NMD protein affecting ribosome stability and mRNA decay
MTTTCPDCARETDHRHAASLDERGGRHDLVVLVGG